MDKQGQAAYSPGLPAQQPIAAPMAVAMPMGRFNLRGESVRMTCPFCHAEITTRVKYHNGGMTHIACLVLCFTTGILCCIPYCTTCCKDASHECPNCNRFIGTFKRL